MFFKCSTVLKIWLVYCCYIGIAVEVQERPILLSTHPTLPKNIVATNFTNLQLIVSINHTFDTICQWLITSAISFSNIFFENHCLEERPNDNYRSTCETTDIIITYNLTFLLPIRTTLDFFVGCYLINDPIEMRNTITIFVQDCSFSAKLFPLQVLPTSGEYSSTGEFYCANGGTLFDSNGNRLISNKTICNATAQWNGQDGLNCLTVPTNVSIIGVFNGVEKSDVSLFCNYTESLPLANKTTFFVGKDEISIFANNEYRRTLSRNDNRKKVRCRVTNPLFYDIIDYNEVDTVSFSEFYELNVTYQPYIPADLSTTVRCNETCNFIFFSNPLAEYVSLVNKQGFEVEMYPKADFYNESHTFIFYNTSKIFGIDRISIVYLTVQSNYNVTFENTTLQFQICDNSAGGCENNFYSTAATTNQLITNTNSTIPIVVGCLVGVSVIVLIVVGFSCWKRKQNQCLSEKENRSQDVTVNVQSSKLKMKLSEDEHKYMTIQDNNPKKPDYEEMGGNENASYNERQTSVMKNYTETSAASTTPYINFSHSPKQSVLPTQFLNINATHEADHRYELNACPAVTCEPRKKEMIDTYTKGKSTRPYDNFSYSADESTTGTPYINMNKQQNKPGAHDVHKYETFEPTYELMNSSLSKKS